MRSDEAVRCAIERYAGMVKRICFIHLKNEADTDDVMQSVFLKYAMHDAPFESLDHEKAWLIRVTINACKDVLKSFFRRHTVPLTEFVEHEGIAFDDPDSEVLQAVLALPEKYRRVIYLHYFEGYTAPQMAELLDLKLNTIYTHLARARDILRETLGGEGQWKES